MFKEGYSRITNVDFSKIVIESMQAKYKDYPESFTCNL
jgi:uncharacterized protein YijF (DUF1287 family)